MATHHLAAIVGSAILLALPASTWATLPPDQTVEFKIHKTPTDPNSPITWTITAELHALSLVGNDYKWEITGVQIHKHSAIPALNEYWYEAYPTVGTSDGYWWVEYVNYQSDFRQLPPIAGLAINDDSSGVDLYYDFIGEAPGTGPENGALTYIVQREGEEDPEDEDDDIPITVPDGVRDPLFAPQ